MNKLLYFSLALIAGLTAQNLLATPGCNNGDFNGIYGILARGAVTVPAPPLTGPFARAGRVQADGKGNVTFNTTASYNGNMFSEQITATYAVSADCSIVFTVSPFAPVFLPATFSGHFTSDQRVVEFMITSPPGQTIHAVLTKQGFGLGEGIGEGLFGMCGAWDLSEPFTVLLEGSVITPATGQLPGFFVRFGTVTPDGKGNFSAQTTANYNGFLIQPENFSGTYTVASDCAITMNYKFNGVSFTWSGGLFNHSRGADLIVSSPAGSAINGTLDAE